jgi:hypothetical protein
LKRNVCYSIIAAVAVIVFAPVFGCNKSAVPDTAPDGGKDYAAKMQQYGRQGGAGGAAYGRGGGGAYGGGPAGGAYGRGGGATGAGPSGGGPSGAAGVASPPGPATGSGR